MAQIEETPLPGVGLAELLGASKVVREIDRLQQSVSGLSIEWLRIPQGSSAAGQTIGEQETRSAGLHPDLGPLATGYVLVLAVAGPVLAGRVARTRRVPTAAVG